MQGIGHICQESDLRIQEHVQHQYNFLRNNMFVRCQQDFLFQMGHIQRMQIVVENLDYNMAPTMKDLIRDII